MEYFSSLTLKQKLGIAIKYHRRQKKLTQNDLSNFINCDQSVISRIELGADVIDIELYNIAMSYFKLSYKSENEDLDSIFNRLWKAFVYVDEESLINLRKELTNYKYENVINLFEFNVIKCFYLMLDKDLINCENCLQELNEVIFICDKKYQLLYLLTILSNKIYMSDYNEAMNVIKTITSIKNDENHIISYFIGWFYFKFCNRSLALKYLLNALEEFQKTNNYKRIYRIKTIIISLLVKEKNYDFAIKETKEVLNTYKQFLSMQEICTLYFLIGYSYLLLENYNEAISYFNIADNIDTDVDKNHIYYYLLNIYDSLDDVKQFRRILNKINNDDENGFGYKIIHLYLQSRIGKSIKYYQYIENEIVPLIPNHYEKMEINHYIQELLTYYYETQQYIKYRQLSLEMIKNFA